MKKLDLTLELKKLNYKAAKKVWGKQSKAAVQAAADLTWHRDKQVMFDTKTQDMANKASE